MNDALPLRTLRAHLLTLPGAPTIIFGNSPGVWNVTKSEWETPPAPYWRAYNVGAPPTRIGLGSTYQLSGRFLIVDLQAEGTFTGESEDRVQTIIDHFPDTLRLPISGFPSDYVKITRRPYADDPYPDGSYFRTNVNVRWSTIQKGN